MAFSLPPYRYICKDAKQACHMLLQGYDTGIHCRHLHGRTLGYCLAGSCAAHIKGVGTARRSVFGLISRLKHSRKNTHIKSRSFLNKQNATVIVNRSTVGVATADCTVECHNRGNGTVNLFCGFGFICFDVSGRVGFDVDVYPSST
jgi:hypothetical protein